MGGLAVESDDVSKIANVAITRVTCFIAIPRKNRDHSVVGRCDRYFGWLSSAAGCQAQPATHLERIATESRTAIDKNSAGFSKVVLG